MRYNGLNIGDKVIANGHQGTVVRLCEWSDSSIEVQLPHGIICVSADEVRSAEFWQRVGEYIASMQTQQAIDAAREAREKMRHDEAAHNYDQAADMCDDPREAEHLRSMAGRCRRTAERKRRGEISPDWQTG